MDLVACGTVSLALTYSFEAHILNLCCDSTEMLRSNVNGTPVDAGVGI